MVMQPLDLNIVSGGMRKLRLDWWNRADGEERREQEIELVMINLLETRVLEIGAHDRPGGVVDGLLGCWTSSVG